MGQMPAMQTKTTADDLKRNVSILDVLGRYGIESQRQGNRHKALCPFHDDHNPSLSVDPVKNIWHCFGCGKGGSSIDFVMQKEGIDFKAAVDRLLLGTGALVRASSLEGQSGKKTDDLAPLTAEERRHVADVVEYYHRTLSGRIPGAWTTSSAATSPTPRRSRLSRSATATGPCARFCRRRQCRP